MYYTPGLSRFSVPMNESATFSGGHMRGLLKKFAVMKRVTDSACKNFREENSVFLVAAESSAERRRQFYGLMGGLTHGIPYRPFVM
jgi:hypothetical protein